MTHCMVEASSEPVSPRVSGTAQQVNRLADTTLVHSWKLNVTHKTSVPLAAIARNLDRLDARELK